MYTQNERQILHSIARQAIQSGLKQHLLSIDISDYSKALQQHKASFITLNINQQLRGCIGSLTAHRPLVKDIAHNAYAAAFSDPRFPPLTSSEFAQLDYHISILSEAVIMQFSSEADLLAQIQPGVDGLILTEKQHRGTFLPSVWEQLSSKEEFLRHLKLKAGLTPDYWSDSLTIERYSVESI